MQEAVSATGSAEAELGVMDGSTDNLEAEYLTARHLGSHKMTNKALDGRSYIMTTII